jgi:putative ABC transport system permease protein
MPKLIELLRSGGPRVALAIRSVTRRRRQSLTGIVAVAFGVVALILAAGFIEWVYWAMREDTIGSRLGHVQIARAGYSEAGTADPFRFLLPDKSADRDAIEGAQGVLAVAPRLSFSALMSIGDATLSFIGEGIDPEKERGFARAVVITEGEGLSAEDPRGIIVGQGLADNLGVKVGDQVVLLANTPSGGVNGVEVRVRGFFSTVSKAFDDSAARVPLPVAQELLRIRGAHTWVVVLDSTSRTNQVVDELRARLSGKGLQVTPWYELADFYNKTVTLFSRQVLVMKLIIAVIIVLSISNTLTMSVLERTGEIGTSMALGVKRRQILAQFVAEGAVIGLIGGVIGIVLGALLAQLISAIGIPMPPPPGMARGFIGEIRLTPPLVAEAFALAVSTTLLASFYPAHKASRMQIVDSLRHNR